jgi:hypothetical protein
MNGKGDSPRPVNLTKYRENYDRIFRKIIPGLSGVEMDRDTGKITKRGYRRKRVL